MGLGDSVGAALSGKERLAIAALVLVLLAAGYFLFLAQPAPVSQQPFSTNYSLTMGSVSLAKTIDVDAAKHVETVKVSGVDARKLAVLALVPKSLASSAAQVSVTTNGSKSVFDEGLILVFSGKNAEHLDVRLEFPVSNYRNTALFVVLPKDFFDSLSEEQAAQLKAELKAFLSVDFDADKAKEVEQALGDKLSAVFAEQAGLSTAPSPGTIYFAAPDSMFNVVFDLIHGFAVAVGAAAPPGQPNPPAVPIKDDAPAKPAGLTDEQLQQLRLLRLEHPWPEILQVGVTEAKPKGTFVFPLVYPDRFDAGNPFPRPNTEAMKPLTGKGTVKPTVYSDAEAMNPLKADENPLIVYLKLEVDYSAFFAKPEKEKGEFPQFDKFEVQVPMLPFGTQQKIDLLVKMNEPGIVVARSPFFVVKEKDPKKPTQFVDVPQYVNTKRLDFIQRYVADAEGWDLVKVPFDLAKENAVFGKEINVLSISTQEWYEKLKDSAPGELYEKQYADPAGRHFTVWISKDSLAMGKYGINFEDSYAGRKEDSYGVDVWDFGEVYYPALGYRFSGVKTDSGLKFEWRKTGKENAHVEEQNYYGDLARDTQLAIKTYLKDNAGRLEKKVPSYLYLIGAEPEIPLLNSVDSKGKRLLEMNPNLEYLRALNRIDKYQQSALDAAFYGNVADDWKIDFAGVSRLPLQSILSLKRYQDSLKSLYDKDPNFSPNLMDKDIFVNAVVDKDDGLSIPGIITNPFNYAQAYAYSGQAVDIDYAQKAPRTKDALQIHYQYPFADFVKLFFETGPKAFTTVVSIGTRSCITRIKDGQIGGAADFFERIDDLCLTDERLQKLMQADAPFSPFLGKFINFLDGGVARRLGEALVRVAYTNVAGFATSSWPDKAEFRAFEPSFSLSSKVSIGKAFVEFIQAQDVVRQRPIHANVDGREAYYAEKGDTSKGKGTLKSFRKTNLLANQLVLYGNPAISYSTTPVPLDEQVKVSTKPSSKDRVVIEMPPLELESLFLKNSELALRESEIKAIQEGRFVSVSLDEPLYSPLHQITKMGNVICYPHIYPEVNQSYLVVETEEDRLPLYQSALMEPAPKEVKWEEILSAAAKAARDKAKDEKKDIEFKKVLVIPSRCATTLHIGFVLVNGKAFYDNGRALIPFKTSLKEADLQKFKKVLEIFLLDGDKKISLYDAKTQAQNYEQYRHFTTAYNTWKGIGYDKEFTLFSFNGRDFSNGITLPTDTGWKREEFEMYSVDTGLNVDFVERLLPVARDAKENKLTPYKIEIALK